MLHVNDNTVKDPPSPITTAATTKSSVTNLKQHRSCFSRVHQILVYFTGNPSSQEINGTFAAVPCESVFLATSASILGVGNSCRFLSGYSLQVFPRSWKWNELVLSGPMRHIHSLTARIFTSYLKSMILRITHQNCSGALRRISWGWSHEHSYPVYLTSPSTYLHDFQE